MPPLMRPRWIENDEELTQYGTTTDPFRNEPRWSRENAISVLLGAWDPLAAGAKVRGFALEDGTDAARYTTAGTLRAKGFVVTHRPTRKNDDHVAVSLEGIWDEEVCQAFDACFGPIEVGAVDEDEFEEEG